MSAVVLISSKSFMRTFPVHINKYMNRFNSLTITNKIRNMLTSGITNDRSNCITGTDRFSNINCFNELANTATLRTLWTLVERTGLLTVDGLTSWLALLTLQTLRLFVLLEQIVLLTFHGLMSLLTPLALQM